MFAQNQMPAATTKWQALFGGMSLAQPTVPSPVPPVEVSTDGLNIALRVGGAIFGVVVGVAISYLVCCEAKKRC